MAQTEARPGLDEARHRMRKWLQQLSQYRIINCPTPAGGWLPSADIHETDDAFHVCVDLAGVDPGSIQLVVEGNTLKLQGDRKRPTFPSDTRVHQMEIDFGSFYRCFCFSVPLRPQEAESSYTNGFLQILLPKLSRSGAVRIPLKGD